VEYYYPETLAEKLLSIHLNWVMFWWSEFTKCPLQKGGL